jgi:hypothetical protein
MNTTKTEKSCKELLKKCWNFIFEYLSDTNISALNKEDMLKKLLHLKPTIKSIQLIIKTEDINYTNNFYFKYNRNEYPELKIWRKEVFNRDNFTCQKCKQKSGKIEAHHIKRWSEYPDLRFDINNGITLCKTCHSKTINYGNKNNAIC